MLNERLRQSTGLLPLLFGVGVLFWLIFRPETTFARPITTLVVNTAVDDVAQPPDSDGLCSLREAITLVNIHAGDPTVGVTNACGTISANPDPVGDPDQYTIEFADNYLIVVAAGAALPPITADLVTIDGTTVNGRVTLAGTAPPPAGSYGLVLQGDNSKISGLTIDDFPAAGILIDDGVNNVIGDVTPGEGNYLINNGTNGVQITGVGATGNEVIGNRIGTIGIGESPNGTNGVLISGGANNNIVGGDVAEESNTIRNNPVGVAIEDPTSDQNIVRLNVIGAPNAAAPIGVVLRTGVSDNTVQENAINAVQTGVLIDNAPNNVIGTGNIIASITLGGNGIIVTGVGSDANQINDNTIGGVTPNLGNGVNINAGASNTQVSGNQISQNTGDGVFLTGVTGTVINNGNIIEDNTGSGITMNGATNTVIDGNGIINNTNFGINILGANFSSITGNGITESGLDGISIETGANNLITSNFIFENDDLGIDLAGDGPTLNDLGDADVGPNTLQNFPIFFASSDGTTTNVVGTIESTAVVDVELFNNTAPGDPSGFGEGQTPVGIFNNQPGDDITIIIPSDLTGAFLTATATSTGGNTSEFSPVVLVDVLRAAYAPNPTSGIAPYTVNFVDQSVSGKPIVTYEWNFGDGRTSNLQNPTITYNTPGIYTVTLTVFNGVGNFDSVTGTVEVLPPPTPTNTPQPTNPPPATSTPNVVNTDAPPATNTPLPTATAIPTNTPLPTVTNTATAIPTNTPLPTATNTATTIPTNTPLPTATNTATAIPTNTPLPTATSTPLPTISPTPALPELEVDKDEGEDSDIVIEVENNGGGPAENLTVIEELRPGVVYIGSVSSPSLCLEDAGTVTCELGTLDPGDRTSVGIDVFSNGPDPLSGNTTVTADGVSPVRLEAPYLIKLGQPAFAEPGETITYTLRVINPTDNAVSSVRVTDNLPSGVTIQSVESTAGSATFSGRSVTFTQGSLPAQGRVTVTIQTTLNEDTEASQLANRACLTSSANPDASCAEFSFSRASRLPATGESPFSLWRLPLFGLLALSGLTLVLIVRRQWRA